VGETWREDPANDVGDDESIAATVNLARTVREAFASINARRPSTESGGAAAQASYVVSFGTEVLRLRAELARVTAERDALRAIIEGRTTPPTDAEIAAHWRARGDGCCRTRRRMCTTTASATCSTRAHPTFAVRPRTRTRIRASSPSTPTGAPARGR